jgi:hypothetical protein
LVAINPTWWEIGRRCSRWWPAQQCIVGKVLLFICLTWKPVRDVGKAISGWWYTDIALWVFFSLARSQRIAEMLLLAAPRLYDCSSTCLHVARTAGRMFMKYDVEEFCYIYPHVPVLIKTVQQEL